MKHNLSSVVILRFLTFGGLLLILGISAGPVTAQTPTPTASSTSSKYTDTPDDIFKNLQSQGYYVSQGAKDSLNEPGLENKLAQTVKKLKDKKHDTRIAVLSERILNDAKQSEGGKAYPYAEYLRKNLKPAPEIVIVLVVVPNGSDFLAMAEDKLDASENSKLLDETFTDIEKKGYGEGVSLLAEKAVDKIGGKWIGIVLIVVGVIVVIVVLVVLLLVVPTLGEIFLSISSSSLE